LTINTCRREASFNDLLLTDVTQRI